MEKLFKEIFGVMDRTDLYIREVPGGAYIITVPHPNNDVEYILKAYRKKDEPKKFVDIGRCVLVALELGAASIHFDLLTE